MCWHKWDKWQQPYEVEITKTHESFGSVCFPLSEPMKYNEERQKRACLKCGKVQERVIG